MALTPQARETFTRLFGVEPQPHPTDPELFDILQNGIFDEAFSTGVLTDVERELLTITALTAMQTLPQLRAHVGAALNIGASPLQLRETIYQCAPYIGFPQTLNAIDIANGVFEANGISLPLENAGTVDATDPSAREQAGAAIQAPLYGNEVKEVFSALPEPFDEFVPHLLTSSAFGDFATRGGLDVGRGGGRSAHEQGVRDGGDLLALDGELAGHCRDAVGRDGGRDEALGDDAGQAHLGRQRRGGGAGGGHGSLLRTGGSSGRPCRAWRRSRA